MPLYIIIEYKDFNYWPETCSSLFEGDAMEVDSILISALSFALILVAAMLAGHMTLRRNARPKPVPLRPSRRVKEVAKGARRSWTWPTRPL